MTELLHHPDTHRLGKKDAKPPHAMVSEFVDVERISVDVPANIINSILASSGLPIPLAMYLNDREGDCTIAGGANTLRVDSNGEKQLTDPDVQAGYVAVTTKEGAGYDPATGANDNGCVELDVLDHWVTDGIGDDKLLGHAGINMGDEQEARACLYLFGSIYPGWALSTDQQSQQIWQPGSAAAGSWGGHCAPIFDWYTQIPASLSIGGVSIPTGTDGVLSLGTWGNYKPALPSYVPFACDEGHALITDVWLERNKDNPALDTAKLTGYLKSLSQES